MEPIKISVNISLPDDIQSLAERYFYNKDFQTGTSGTQFSGKHLQDHKSESINAELHKTLQFLRGMSEQALHTVRSLNARDPHRYAKHLKSKKSQAEHDLESLLSLVLENVIPLLEKLDSNKNQRS